jgi:hypothetical protein
LLFKSKGDFAGVVANYTLALRFNPNYGAAYNNLAWLWSTRPDEKFRDVPKALEYAHKACELSKWANCPHLFTLGGAYAEVGNNRGQWTNRIRRFGRYWAPSGRCARIRQLYG